MDTTQKISALAITFNEAAHIEGFIRSLDFADEIIIVDSYSQDDTVKIAKGFENVKVIQRPFEDFSDQKNFAIQQASHPWVLFFDPDEEVTPPLREEILNAVANPKADAYLVRRQFYFMGKKIRYSGFQTDWVVRLFRAESGRYNGRLVHETLNVRGTTARLRTRVPHHTYTGMDDYTAKLHRYSALQAQMLYERKKRPNLFHFLFRPFYRFWHQYLLRLGILDGKEGFILAYINAFSVFKRYTNLWLLYRKID
ncbi:glycosyltransferase family 2 protein [Aureitalea marina]|uniref:Glycosyl transferase family 2 n=1 Tax=Aureitalea marina TaxID=930804 RepID=A0A2S7KQ25_9FLAO|nr:glycosyltransferase family 2 protein [Aureitalea marina]PQB04729.1 glycosyl transferase family 2 [Aureitalea marina]